MALVLLWIPWRWRQAYLGLDFVLIPMVALYLPYSQGGNPRYWVSVSILFSVSLLLRLSSVWAGFRVMERRLSIVCIAIVLVANLTA